MKLIGNRDKAGILFSSVLLIFVLSTFISCGGQEAEEGLPQEVPPSQEKIEQLEKKIEEKEEAITELQENYAELESQVPVSHEVQSGDSHWEIAYDYLTKQEGLSEEEAVNKLSDTLLYHPIRVGFYVWNYFYEGTFGSFITQGTATVSPGTVMRNVKKETEEEKAALEIRITNLQNEKQDLVAKMGQMQKDYEDEKTELNDRVSSLKNDLNEAEVKAQGLEERLNSVYYLVGQKDELKDQEKIKGTFLGICGTRIKNVTFNDFEERIDLLETDTIALDASDLGLSQIRKIGLLPKYLEEGVDYRVEIAGDRQSARVILLDKEKVRLARLIIFLN